MVGHASSSIPNSTTPATVPVAAPAVPDSNGTTAELRAGGKRDLKAPCDDLLENDGTGAGTLVLRQGDVVVTGMVVVLVEAGPEPDVPFLTVRASGTTTGDDNNGDKEGKVDDGPPYEEDPA